MYGFFCTMLLDGWGCAPIGAIAFAQPCAPVGAIGFAQPCVPIGATGFAQPVSSIDFSIKGVIYHGGSRTLFVVSGAALT